MKNTFPNKKIIPVLISVLVFLLISFLYYSPVLSGKTLSMHDVNQGIGMTKEVMDFKEKTGQWAWWTNNAFGGMPTFMIGGGYPYSMVGKVAPIINSALPTPVNLAFLCMVGFYILMLSLKKSNWISTISSVAYAFGTYNLLFTEAGHLSKILALAYAPIILAGFVWIFRKKYLLGTFITALGIGLELYANHLQITYYFVFILLAYTIYESIRLVKAKEFKTLIISGLCLLVASLVGIGTNAERLWSGLVYSSESTRGKSELTTSTAGTNGLDKDYAFGWSYGLDETINLLVPNLMGGGSSGSLSKKSETYQSLTAGGVDPNMAEQFIKQLPLYFGEQSITSGPAYSGIIIIFLFVLGLFIVKTRFKWILFSLTLFFIMFSWGYHFSSINDLLFTYLPGYNKFRAVTMTLVIVHFLLVWGASMTLKSLFDKIDWAEIKKPIYYTFGILTFIMALGYMMVDFSGPNDEQFRSSLSQSLGQDFASRLLLSLQSDRASMAQTDIFRGLILMALLVGLFYFYSKNKFSETILGIALFILVTFDLFFVGKRYFNNDDFVTKSESKTVFEPSALDLEIMKDTDPNYRVLNLTTGFWSDSRDSYFHKSLGGYHGAKLKKIQELYDNQIVKDGKLNTNIINMMNVKYFITNGPSNTPIVQQNPLAAGNAWFVDTLKVVNNADEEIKALTSFNPKSIAFTQKNQKINEQIRKVGSIDSIKLTSYAPNRLSYSVNSSQNNYAVFSEIFYRGNKDWKSYIDGKEVPHQKVNYVLRGMEVPAGKHEIVFEFKPESVEKGGKIDLAASIALGLLGISALITSFLKRN